LSVVSLPHHLAILITLVQFELDAHNHRQLKTIKQEFSALFANERNFE
jgi:hypothetical protein